MGQKTISCPTAYIGIEQQILGLSPWHCFSVTWGDRTIIFEAAHYPLGTADEALTTPNYLCSEHQYY